MTSFLDRSHKQKGGEEAAGAVQLAPQSGTSSRASSSPGGCVLFSNVSALWVQSLKLCSVVSTDSKIDGDRVSTAQPSPKKKKRVMGPSRVGLHTHTHTYAHTGTHM